jgi:hypothetical protein
MNMPEECRRVLELCFAEVEAVFQKYGVVYDPGCGCCGGGVWVKDAAGREHDGDLRGFGSDKARQT